MTQDTNEATSPLVHFVLMRDDLASLNPGKAVAQGNHAGTRLTSMLRKGDDRMRALLDEWEAQTNDGFGTVETLAGDEATIRAAVARSTAAGLVAGLLVDPTYPVRDGAVTHHIPLMTCGYVFGRRDAGKAAIGNVPRMP